MGKKVKNMGRKQQKAVMAKMNARHFHDDPSVRGGLDRKQRHKHEPWERNYKRK